MKKFLELDEMDKVVVRVSEGLAGWLTFQKFSRNRKNLNEYDLYAPITDILRKYNWTIVNGYRVRNSNVLKRRLIDFMIQKNISIIDHDGGDLNKNISSSALIEVKYISDVPRKEAYHANREKNLKKSDRLSRIKQYYKSPSYIPKDIENINNCSSELNTKIKKGYLLIAGPKMALAEGLGDDSVKESLGKYHERFLEILSSEQDCLFGEYGWRCDEIGEDYQGDNMTVLVIKNF